MPVNRHTLALDYFQSLGSGLKYLLTSVSGRKRVKPLKFVHMESGARLIGCEASGRDGVLYGSV